MMENFSKARLASGAVVPLFFLFAAVVLYYAFLLLLAAGVTTGKFSLFAPVENGLTFNSMLAHLLHGEFDVDPAAISFEGFVRGGKTYAYFGVFVALLRLPLVLVGDLAHLDVTVLSCLMAGVTIAASQSIAIVMVWRALPPSGLRQLLGGTLVVATLLSGPEITFLKPSIYQEVVLWANALAAAFVSSAVYGMLRGGFGGGLLTGMAILAGLCLNTRVSTAVGPYAATGLLLLRSAWLAAKNVENGRRALIALLAPAAVLAIFAAASGVVNYERFGNPLTFADARLNLVYQNIYPQRLIVLTEHGVFNPARIGYALFYYLLPLWAIRASDGDFIFAAFQHRFFDSVELPPAGLLLSDSLIVSLAALSVLLAWRRRRRPGIDTSSMSLVAAGLSLPMLLMLTFVSLSYRYRGEFYPLIQFLACAGFFLVCARSAPWVAAPPASLRTLALIGCVLSILGSHVSLVLYDFSGFGAAEDIVPDRSVVGYYHHRLDVVLGAFSAAPRAQ